VLGVGGDVGDRGRWKQQPLPPAACLFTKSLSCYSQTVFWLQDISTFLVSHPLDTWHMVSWLSAFPRGPWAGLSVPWLLRTFGCAESGAAPQGSAVLNFWVNAGHLRDRGSWLCTLLFLSFLATLQDLPTSGLTMTLPYLGHKWALGEAGPFVHAWLRLKVLPSVGWTPLGCPIHLGSRDPHRCALRAKVGHFQGQHLPFVTWWILSLWLKTSV
jgi:hypothetical protein